MIGTDLNLNIPLLEDTYSVALSKIGVALQAIEDSIADKATQAGINVIGNLSLNGSLLTDVGGVLLVAGNTPVAEGSVYYAGGYFYVRDATGPIQLTSAGAINASGFGAIGGDYGGGNPASVNYDDASGQYRFKEDATTWADVVVDDVILMETGGGTDFVRLTAPASVPASYTVTLPAAPPAELSVMQMATDGTISASNVLASISSVTLDSGGDVTVSGQDGHFCHGDRYWSWSAGTGVYCPSGAGLSYSSTAFGAGAPGWLLAAGSVAHYHITPPSGIRIKEIRVAGDSVGADWTGTVSFQNGSSIGAVPHTVVGTLYDGDATPFKFLMNSPGYQYEGYTVIRITFSGGTAQPLRLGHFQFIYDMVSYTVPPV